MNEVSLNRRLGEALGWRDTYPLYDTEPDAVFGPDGLIEAMRERGYYVSIMFEIADNQPDAWAASFERLDFDDQWTEFGMTPMEAIARAAIAALDAWKVTEKTS